MSTDFSAAVTPTTTHAPSCSRWSFFPESDSQLVIPKEEPNNFAGFLVRVLSVNVEQNLTKLNKQKPGGGLILLGFFVGVCSLWLL